MEMEIKANKSKDDDDYGENAFVDDDRSRSSRNHCPRE